MACQSQASVHHLRGGRSSSSRVLDSVRRPRHARQAAFRVQAREDSPAVCAHTRRVQRNGERRHSAREEDGTEGGHYLLDQECGLCHRLGRRRGAYRCQVSDWTSSRAAYAQVIDYTKQSVPDAALASPLAPFAVVLDCVGGTEVVQHIDRLILHDPQAPELGIYVTIVGDSE